FLFALRSTHHSHHFRAADVRSRLLFLRQPDRVRDLVLSEGARVHEEVCLHWLTVLFLSFYLSDGLAVFRHFLRSEFSDENLDFWLAVERFKKTRSANKMATRAAKIYDEFISTTAGRQVNVDSSVRESTYQRLRPEVNPASFQLAQDQIFSLMETDSYPRFLRSRLYAHVIKKK
uniref:RGS domain-containing protein n=1 Tax=Mola mola TaxID=94237 RepID=A0A3Q3X9U3_MOLML